MFCMWLLCGVAHCGAPLQPEPAQAQTTDKPGASAIAAGDALTPVRERVRAHDAAGALILIQALDPELGARRELRYLRARLYEQEAQLEAALTSLPEDLAGLPEPVASDIRRRRALWMAQTRRCAEAQPLIQALARDNDLNTELRVHAADCAVALGDKAAALSLASDRRSTGRERFSLRKAAAQVLLAAGDRDEAVRELRALYVEFPSEPQSSEVLQLLRANVRGFQLTPQETFSRAARFIEAAQPDPAWTELNQIKLPPARTAQARRAQQPERARLLHLKGMALFRMRSRYPEAAKVLKEASLLESPTQSEDAFHAAQALARSDRNKAAVRAFEAFAQRYPRDRWAFEAKERAAWLELRHNLPNGEKHMRAILERAERTGAKGTAATALWELASYAFKHKHCDRALPLFERYANTGQDPLVKGRGLYWAGRCAATLGDRTRAAVYYKSTLAIEPLHWYALLARARLKAAGQDPGPPFQLTRTDAGTEATKVDLQLPPAAAFYANLGLDEDAVQALRAHESALRQGRDEAGLPRLIAAYHALGEYARPFSLASRERESTQLVPPTRELRPIWDALYPRAFAADMAAVPDNITHELVYAVMRRESAFNPRVVSNADAIGLLQLIERTATRCAQEVGMGHFERKLLYDPTTNIRLGSHYLASLVARYRGQAVPAIAAYNAGEHRVDPWLDRAMRADRTIEMDWFVEDIPYDQTRDYVRKVVASWARYIYLYQRPDGAWPIDLALTFKR